MRQKLWPNKRIAQEFCPYQYAIDAAQKMRDEYETEARQLTARIAELIALNKEFKASMAAEREEI